MMEFAKKELDIIGLTEENETNAKMRKHILFMVNTFAEENHSGFSAAYSAQILEKLLRFEPLSPLQGTDDEWVYMRDMNSTDSDLYQNTRCSHVFKENNDAYDIDGIIFIEHFIDSDGVENTYAFTNKDSRVSVVFPYTPKQEYVDVGFRKVEQND